MKITKNIRRTQDAGSKGSLKKLEGEVHGVVNGEGPDEPKECHIEDADDESQAPTVVVRDVPSDGQRQEGACAAKSTRQGAHPFLAAQVELRNKRPGLFRRSSASRRQVCPFRVWNEKMAGSRSN